MGFRRICSSWICIGANLYIWNWESTHCQDVKGLGEQDRIQAAVQWLGNKNGLMEMSV